MDYGMRSIDSSSVLKQPVFDLCTNVGLLSGSGRSVLVSAIFPTTDPVRRVLLFAISGVQNFYLSWLVLVFSDARIPYRCP
jgi:hypothetical protein